MGQAKIKAEQAKAAAAATGRVPISVDTTLRLARLFSEWQFAKRLENASGVAYLEALGNVAESLDLGVPVLVQISPTERRVQIDVDFKARELVLPTPEPAQPEPELKEAP